MLSSGIVLIVVGVAFLVVSFVMTDRKKKKKSTSQRLAEVFADYDKQMEKFRN